MGDGVPDGSLGQSRLAELKAFLDTLPQGLKDLLQVNPKGIFADYVNKLIGIQTALFCVYTSEDLADFGAARDGFPLYSEYLKAAVVGYNDKVAEVDKKDPDSIVQALMNVDSAVALEDKMRQIKGFPLVYTGAKKFVSDVAALNKLITDTLSLIRDTSEVEAFLEGAKFRGDDEDDPNL